MTTETDRRVVRKAVRRGNAMARLRKELHALDDPALCKRLGKYQGRTVGEVRRNYAWAWPTNGKAIHRDVVIDTIVNYEVPA